MVGQTLRVSFTRFSVGADRELHVDVNGVGTTLGKRLVLVRRLPNSIFETETKWNPDEKQPPCSWNWICLMKQSLVLQQVLRPHGPSDECRQTNNVIHNSPDVYWDTVEPVALHSNHREAFANATSQNRWCKSMVRRTAAQPAMEIHKSTSQGVRKDVRTSLMERNHQVNPFLRCNKSLCK